MSTASQGEPKQINKEVDQADCVYGKHLGQHFDVGAEKRFATLCARRAQKIRK